MIKYICGIIKNLVLHVFVYESLECLEKYYRNKKHHLVLEQWLNKMYGKKTTAKTDRIFTCVLSGKEVSKT